MALSVINLGTIGVFVLKIAEFYWIRVKSFSGDAGGVFLFGGKDELLILINLDYFYTCL